jgi:hypothetical protein
MANNFVYLVYHSHINKRKPTKGGFMKNQFLLIVGAIVLTCNLQAQFQKSHFEFPGTTNRNLHESVYGQINLKKDLPIYPLKQNLFNPDSVLWHWDTIVCYNKNSGIIYRISETFNGCGGVIERLTEAWSNNTWTNYSRTSNTYDENGYAVVNLIEDWVNNNWEGHNRHSYTYDSSGKLLSWDWYLWQSNGLKKVSLYSMIYDANGNIDSMYVDKGENDQWVKYIRFDYTCDSNGDILIEQKETWSDSVWMLSYRNNYTYDGNGNQTMILTEIWQNSIWVNSSRGTTTYDTNGNSISSLYELWQNTAWNNSSLTTYAYDGYNYLASQLVQDWGNNTWNNLYSILFLNDSSGNMLMKVWRDWQSGWQNNYKQTYAYDLSGNSITGTYEIWESPGVWMPGVGQLVVFSNHKYDFPLDLGLHRYTATINPVIVGISPTRDSRLLVFPNPAHSEFRIKSDKDQNGSNICISIFTLEGQFLTTKVLTDMSSPIDISYLSNGIYIVKLTNSEKTGVIKLVKE